MKFGKPEGSDPSDIRTYPITDVILSEKELRTIKRIAAPGVWKVNVDGSEVRFHIHPDHPNDGE